MLKIKLNGKEIEAKEGSTILDIAQENGIEIPTLCHDEELKPFGSCWVCAVQVSGRRGFVTSCGTELTDGMEITTDSDEIHRARKMALELLLSDHYADCEAPCKLACPDNVDVQSYVALIANDQQHEAVKVIKDTLPMPLSIGRVCPAFCERECRRTLVEEPVAIRQLKRYAADIDLNDYWSYVPPREDSNDKKVAVIGAGPSGLTCGYYLTQKGYDVTVFEAAPEAGGWLYYGIPEYRLPKVILKKEIELMCANGMKIETNKKLGSDFNLAAISSEFDAVYLALGAQNAVPMKVKGSDLPGSYLGVDYLRDLMLGKEVKTGKRVAVVGGGNTAIDCARTARRYGAEVTIIYRRTRKEMPAEAYEVDAAEEEGIKLQLLANPVEYIGDEAGIKEVKIEKMRLGEPDASGRQRPEPTGEYFVEPFDMVIAAISQVPEVQLFAEDENKIEGKTLPLSRWSTADVDENLLFTGMKNVFAGGDFRLGPATAIEAIADGRRAAENIDIFLQNGYIDHSLIMKKPFTSVKAEKLKKMDELLYSMYPEVRRYKMEELDPKERSGNFEEVEVGFSQKEALNEADRCLECGCMVNYRCSLRDYATEYDVQDALFFGDKNRHPIDDSHPFILRDVNKCIKCGRCVRICSEVQGAGVLGYIYRGFTTFVAPEFGESLTKTTCESCGKCITVCPVGALTEKNNNLKEYPLEDTVVDQNCGLCGTGCDVAVHSSLGNISYVSHPEEQGFNRRNLCFYGKFGWQALKHSQRIHNPVIKVDNGWKEIDWQEAAEIIKRKAYNAKKPFFSVSPHNTNEEILLMKEIAAKFNQPLGSFTFKEIFTDPLFRENLNNISFEDLTQAEDIIIVGEISHTLRTLCRTLQREGKRLILINNTDNKFNHFADIIYQDEDLALALDKLANIGASPKSIFLYNRNKISEPVIAKLWQIASGICEFNQSSGVIETSDWNNLNGFRLHNIKEAQASSESDLVFIYGERLERRLFDEKDCYIVAVDTHVDEDYPANLVLPKPSYLEIDGSVLSDDNHISYFHNPEKSTLFYTLLQIIYEAGLIAFEQVEPSLWITKSEKFYKEVCSQQQLDRDEVLKHVSTVKPSSINLNNANVSLWNYLNELKESCRCKKDDTQLRANR